MGLPLERIEREIRELDAASRDRLLRQLLADLEAEPQESLQAPWLAESHRRYRELREGSVESIPAEDVLRKARRRLRDAG